MRPTREELDGAAAELLECMAEAAARCEKAATLLRFHPALLFRSLADATDEMQGDVRDLLLALGLGDHARPISPHRIVQDEILPAINALRERAS